MGVLFAIIALLSWGSGDFLIQRSTRKFGDWISLFYITAIGAIILSFFVYNDLELIFTLKNFFLLVAASILILFVALSEFEAFRVGKISVIEPILALEVLVTVALSSAILREHLNFLQTLSIAFLLLGIILVSIKSFHHFKKFHLERGIWHAFFATLGMGVVNLLFGVGSRNMSPLLVNWFTSAFIALVCLVYIVAHSRYKEALEDLKKNKKLIFGVGIVDNIAWIAYSYATLFIPIAIAIGISESYIALAATLGMILNKEKLKKHQVAGLVVCVISVVVLSIITEV